MKPQFYLNPFKSQEDTAIKATGGVYQHKSNCKVVSWFSGQGFLREIPNISTLLIDGHSSPGVPEIVSHDVSGRNIVEHYDAQTIACLLRDFGDLPRNHVFIRVLACFGGKDAPAGICFAKALATSLGQTYPNIAVGGYFWSVNTMVEGGTRYRIGEDEYSREDLAKLNTYIQRDGGQQLERIRWFRNDGTIIAKPEIYDPLHPTT